MIDCNLNNRFSDDYSRRKVKKIIIKELLNFINQKFMKSMMEILEKD
jgi:hypothetical protein